MRTGRSGSTRARTATLGPAQDRDLIPSFVGMPRDSSLPARTADTVPAVVGDAHAALVDALARGAAVGHRERRARR